MKICFDGKNFVIYQFLLQKFTKDKNELEEQFRTLFLHLNQLYQTELEGYYKIQIYHDDYYGNILEIEKEELDYFFDHTIEMQIQLKEDCHFLYEVEEHPGYIGTLYESKGKLYFELKEKIDSIDFGKLLEKSKIIYNEETVKIKNNSTIVR